MCSNEKYARCVRRDEIIAGQVAYVRSRRRRETPTMRSLPFSKVQTD
jgi:hypothetical protein